MIYPTAILDIGTSKVICLIGGRGVHGRMELYGSASQQHDGLRKQTFLNQQSVRDAIRGAIQLAEKEAKRSIHEIRVGVPNSMIQTICSRTTISYEKMHVLAEEDFDSVINKSLQLQQVSENWLHLDSHIERFEMNHATFKKFPLDTSTNEWTAIVANTYFRKGFEDFIRNILLEMNIDVTDFVDSMYAEAELILQEVETDQVLVDVGYYQTNLLVLRNQAPIYRACIEVGGHHMANDIHYVLDIAPAIAEEIKQRHVFGLDYMEQSNTYQQTNGTVFECDYETIQNIMEVRALEMADILMEELRKSPMEITKSTLVYMAGGGILMMRGGCEFLQQNMDVMLKTPQLTLPKQNSPNYYSAYGVLDYCLEKDSIERNNDWKKSFMQAIVRFFIK